MTNKEKFKEIFGLEIDDTSDCGFFDCTDRKECKGCPVKDTKDWWNAEYKEPTIKSEALVSLDVYKQVKWERDIAIRQLHELGYEFGQKIKPTKDDLGVDCVARQDVERYIEGFINEYTPKEELEFINLELDGLKHLPSVTPQEPQTFKWCTNCKEYDQEKHCCHRWSKVIRDTVEEMKQEQEPILDKIREQIKDYLRGVEITLEVLVENDPLRPKMEGAKDTLEECLDLIDKAETEAEHDE